MRRQCMYWSLSVFQLIMVSCMPVIVGELTRWPTDGLCNELTFPSNVSYLPGHMHHVIIDVCMIWYLWTKG